MKNADRTTQEADFLAEILARLNLADCWYKLWINDINILTNDK